MNRQQFSHLFILSFCLPLLLISIFLDTAMKPTVFFQCDRKPQGWVYGVENIKQVPRGVLGFSTIVDVMFFLCGSFSERWGSKSYFIKYFHNFSATHDWSDMQQGCEKNMCRVVWLRGCAVDVVYGEHNDKDDVPDDYYMMAVVGSLPMFKAHRHAAFYFILLA